VSDVSAMAHEGERRDRAISAREVRKGSQFLQAGGPSSILRCQREIKISGIVPRLKIRERHPQRGKRVAGSTCMLKPTELSRLLCRGPVHQTLDWPDTLVRKVWLKAYGFVLVSKIVASNGDIAYLAPNDLSLETAETIKTHFANRWTIETFHRGIKQCAGIEKYYPTIERSQGNYILYAFLAFLTLEWERIQNAVSWYEQKWSIPRLAVKAHFSGSIV